MYLNESSRVLVYWFESHSMLGCCMYSWLRKCIRLHDEIILCSCLPYCLWLYILWCGLFFCNDHQLVDVSRGENSPN